MDRTAILMALLLGATSPCLAQETFTSAQRAEIARMLTSEVESARVKILRDLCNEFAVAGTTLPKSCAELPAVAERVKVVQSPAPSAPSASPATSAEPEQFSQTLYFGRVAAATLDRDVDGGLSRIEFSNSTDGGRASIRLSDTDSDEAGNGDKTFTVKSATLSTPLDKENDETHLLTADGFANATTLELRYGKLFVRGVRSPRTAAGLVPKAQALYKRAGLDPVKQFDLGTVWSALEEKKMLYLYPEFESLYWAGDASRWTYGGVVKVGTETHKFIPIGTTLTSKDKTIPWGVGVYGGFLPRGRSDLYFGGGLEFQRAYEAAKSRTVCPTNASGDVVECLTGAYGSPSEEENYLIYLEARKAFHRFSASAKVVHDLNNDATKVDVPFFLYSDPEGKVSTGFRVGWTNEDAFSFGVFVGTAFNLGADPSP